MSFTNPTTPNLPDFLVFVTGVMQVDALYLGTSPDAVLTFPFYRAQALVIQVPCTNAYDYTNAVYNCAGHILIATAQDVVGRTFFKDQRKGFGIGQLAAGLVTSTSDASTSTSLATPDSLKNLTVSDLWFMKTPWGREYISYNQDFGTVFGLS